MTIFRNLTPEGDWTFGHGKGDYVSQNAAIGLDIRTRILSWLNDCFFDMGAGVDWINRLGSKNQKTLLEADLRRIILTTENVTGILEFDTSLNLDNRGFTANYSVSTIYSKSFVDQVTLGLGNA